MDKKLKNNFNQTGHLIAIGGLSGSGKTTIAYALKDKLKTNNKKCVNLSSDAIRKELFGVSETTRLPDEAYKWDFTKKVIAEMEGRISKNLKKGNIVIIDAVFGYYKNRDRQIEVAQESKASFSGFFLMLDKETLIDRVTKRMEQGNSISDAGPDIVERQLKSQTEVTDWENIQADNSIEDIVNTVSASLSAQNPEMFPQPKTEKQVRSILKIKR